jgi:hypothetical protein
MPFDALGIHNMIVEIRITRFDSRRSDLWNKKSTPRHDYVPFFIL